MSDGVWRREEKQWHFLVPWHVLQVLMLTWLSPSPLPAPSPGCCSLDFQPGLSPGPGGLGLGTLQTQQGNNIEIFQQATCSCVPPSLPRCPGEGSHSLQTPRPVCPPRTPSSFLCPTVFLSSRTLVLTRGGSPVFWGQVWKAAAQAPVSLSVFE